MLIIYTVKTNDGKVDVQLNRMVKTFAKKAVIQMAVISEFHILISLSGNKSMIICKLVIKHVMYFVPHLCI